MREPPRGSDRLGKDQASSIIGLGGVLGFGGEGWRGTQYVLEPRGTKILHCPAEACLLSDDHGIYTFANTKTKGAIG